MFSQGGVGGVLLSVALFLFVYNGAIENWG